MDKRAVNFVVEATKAQWESGRSQGWVEAVLFLADYAKTVAGPDEQDTLYSLAEAMKGQAELIAKRAHDLNVRIINTRPSDLMKGT